MINERTRLILYASLGAALGFFWSVVFLLIYYGQQFSAPVSDAIRLKSAFLIATYVMIIIVAIMNYRFIITKLKEAFAEHDDLDDNYNEDE